MKKIFKEKQNGITLIALIITIIVLLILAGISIGTLTGENGLIKKASKGKEESEIASEKEILEMATIETMEKNKYGDIEKQELQEAINNQIGEEKVEISKLGEEFGVVFKESNRQYIIDQYGNIRIPEWNQTAQGITNGEITLQIGDYVSYDHTEGVNLEDTEKLSYTSKVVNSGRSQEQVFNISSYSSETQGWRVLGIENGKLLLISADIIGPDSGGYTDTTTGQTYYWLVGQIGYQNGIEELNKISSMYGNGKYSEKARSVTVDDINKITGFNPECIGIKNPTEEQIANGTKANNGAIYEYGNKITYSWDGTDKPYYSGTNKMTGSLGSHSSFYWFSPNENQWKMSTKSTTATTENMEEIITLDNSYYAYYPETLSNIMDSNATIGIGEDTSEYDTLFQNTSGKQYFLGSRQVWNLDKAYVAYGTCKVINGHVDCQFLVKSTGQNNSVYSGIRPVVTLIPGLTFTKEGDKWVISE